MAWSSSEWRKLASAIAVAAALALVILPAGPARADNCSGGAIACSAQCVRLGKLYDRRNQAVERVYRKLERNSRQLTRAEQADPVRKQKVKRLRRRDTYLRKLYDRRHARLMRTYRKFLRTCF